MSIQKIHHVAYRCKDAKETVEWYMKYLNMKFILAIAEDEVPSTKAPDPYMHVFMDAGGGNVLAPKGLNVGMSVVSGAKTDIKVGNALEMRNMPEGTIVHNLELKPGKGGIEGRRRFRQVVEVFHQVGHMQSGQGKGLAAGPGHGGGDEVVHGSPVASRRWRGAR